MAQSSVSKFFLGDNSTTVSIVERTEEPMGWLEGTKRVAVSALRGGFISAALSGAVGAVIGAISGYNTDGEVFAKQLAENGEIKLGGYNIPGIGSGPALTVESGSMLAEGLSTNPALAGAEMGAINSALNVATTASLVGAGVGAIREGWADRITKERILQQQTIERS